MSELSESEKDPLDALDEMLKRPELLLAEELKWVKRIDKTVAEFDGPTCLTERQSEVILSIYAKYCSRTGPMWE
jgi:hypothetical protein